MSKEKMNIIQRAKAPTPKFFKILKVVGLSLAGTSAAILAAPIAFPAVIIALAGYLTVAGGVITAVSQVVVEGE